MKIFNETKTQILSQEQCDMEKGHFVEENIINELSESEIILVYVPYTDKELKEIEIRKLENWFETEYRETYEKCTRKIALGILMRDGSNPQQVLSNLYNQAEINATRIRELEKIIQENKTND